MTEALEKIESDVKLSAVAIAVLKTIGMLNWLSEIGPFKATAENVTYAMRGADHTDEQIAEALQDLQQRSAIVFRRFNQSFVIWQGSDVDIDERIGEARQRQLGGFSVTQAVQRYVPPQPIIARRHSYQTGTTRFFDVRYVDSTDQALAVTAAGGASGTVYLCLSAPRPKPTPLRIGRKANSSSSAVMSS